MSVRLRLVKKVYSGGTVGLDDGKDLCWEEGWDDLGWDGTEEL